MARNQRVRLVCDECGEVGWSEDVRAKLDAAYEEHVMEAHAPTMVFERSRPEPLDSTQAVN